MFLLIEFTETELIPEFDWIFIDVKTVTSDGLILMKKPLRLYETLSTLGQGKRLILSLSL